MVATVSTVVTSTSTTPPPQVQQPAAVRGASRSIPRFVKPGPGREFYFGYGANMAPRVVQGRNLAPRSAKPAVLHNHKLYFSHIGGAVQLLSLPILLVGVDNLPVSLVAPHFNACGSSWNQETCCLHRLPCSIEVPQWLTFAIHIGGLAYADT